MIVTETVTINGKQYLHTYSDDGKTILRDGIEYDDAYDPIETGRTYTETANFIEGTVEQLQAKYESLLSRYSIAERKAARLDTIKARIETLRDEALLSTTKAIYQTILDLFEES